MAHKIGYARVGTADQDPQLQLDALEAEGCLKIYKDIATGTKAGPTGTWTCGRATP